LVSILRSSQQHHRLCSETLREIRPPLLTCWPVLTEAAYLLRRRPDEVRALLGSCASGFLHILLLGSADVAGINAILAKYEDQGLQLADGTLMYLAEREGIEHVFTLDRTDFSLYRTRAGKALTILPA
jgi:hypothetical protein